MIVGVTVGSNSLTIDPNAYNSLSVGKVAQIVYSYSVQDDSVQATRQQLKR